MQEVLVEDGTLRHSNSGVVVDLYDSPAGPIALSLCLLRHALVDAVVFRPQKGAWVLRIVRAEESDESWVRKYGDLRVEVRLGLRELERWTFFFLRYYRDGMAEVDHIDTSARWDYGGECDLTLKVSKYTPPVSEEEARRRLGLSHK